jgi:K+/H+ antiporter YhaU regulatory subunit KhtT
MALPDVYEIDVDEPFVDQSLRESRIRERFGVTVVAVRRSSGELLVNPPADTEMTAGDKIRVFGLREQIDNFMIAKQPAKNDQKADSRVLD